MKETKKKNSVKREGQRERERLTDGEKNGFFACRRQREENSSEQRETKGKRD